MTWIKLDDRAPRHPKLASLTDRAFRWWILGLCYASEFLTNGVLHPVFWKRAPSTARKELTIGKLWDWDDPNFLIHDYLEHQTSRESVEKERRRNRERRRGDRRDDAGGTTGTTAGTPAGSTAEKPRPEDREQIQRTENRVAERRNGHAAALVMSPLAYERRKQQCAFVGARLEIPHMLHSDMRKLLGGANAETDLLAWYGDLDAEIEASGEVITPDVFKWLKARFARWKSAAAAPTQKTTAEIMAEIAALPKGIGR